MPWQVRKEARAGTHVCLQAGLIQQRHVQQRERLAARGQRGQPAHALLRHERVHRRLHLAQRRLRALCWLALCGLCMMPALSWEEHQI